MATERVAEPIFQAGAYAMDDDALEGVPETHRNNSTTTTKLSSPIRTASGKHVYHIYGEPSKMHQSQRTLWTNAKHPASLVGHALRGMDKEGSSSFYNSKRGKEGGGEAPPPPIAPSLDRVQRGIPVLKVTSRGKIVSRILTVSADRFAIFVTHKVVYKKDTNLIASVVGNKLSLPVMSRKGILGVVSRDAYLRYIDVADIDGIQVGVVGTQRLEAARSTVGDKSVSGGGSNGQRKKDTQTIHPKATASTYRSQSGVDVAVDQIVSILHHGNESLDVFIPEARDRTEFVVCLRLMCQTYHEAKANVSNEALLLRYIWYDVDGNRDGLIGPYEWTKILDRINFHVDAPQKVFMNYSKELAEANKKEPGIKKDLLTYTEVMNLLQRLKKSRNSGGFLCDRPWNNTFGRDMRVVNVRDFLHQFLHIQQGQTHLTLDDAKEIFLNINSMEMNHTEGEPEGLNPETELSRPRFELFLLDTMNSAYDPWAVNAEAAGPLVQPISHYWINTSHNTYLSGDQIQSKSSVEMYMRALRRGCKCLELDCWDGKTTKEGHAVPVVYHGHTLTSKILFADIILGVKSFLVTNPKSYPIILSLENHCSHAFQRSIATILKGALGKLLYVPEEYQKEGSLPSPEYMRGKVVIKGKRPPDPDEGDVSSAVEEDGDNEVVEDQANGKKSGKPPKVVSELAQLTLFHGIGFKNFEQSILEPCSHMHSIGETKINKVLGEKKATNSILWRQYNARHMTRTYPAGKRVDSSNYNPILAWGVGCQLVALNFQTADTPLVLNDGRFRENQGCGYIHKPPSVLDQIQTDNNANSTRAILPAAPAPPTTSVQESTLPCATYEKDTLDKVFEGFEGVVCGINESNPCAVPEEEKTRTDDTQPHPDGPRITQRMLSFRANRTNRVDPMRLRIRILGASCLPKPRGEKVGEKIDPYVTVTLHDVRGGTPETGKATYVTANFSTSTVNENGFCPVWGDRSLKEFKVLCPEVAMLQFTLNEADFGLNDKVAQAAIPCNRLRKGYRSVQLYDTNNTRTGPFAFATLLVELQILRNV